MWVRAPIKRASELTTQQKIACAFGICAVSKLADMDVGGEIVYISRRKTGKVQYTGVSPTPLKIETFLQHPLHL